MIARYMVMIILLSCLCDVSARGGDDIVFEGLTLSLSVPKTVYLGSEIMLGVTLKSAKTQLVYSVGSADLMTTVKDAENPEKSYAHERKRYRFIKRKSGNSAGLSMTVKTDKKAVLIGGNENSDCDIDLLQEVNTRLLCGNYNVSVVYEGKVTNNTAFAVVVDANRTVPALIDLAGDSDEWTRNWARDALYSLIGQPEWSPSRDDTRERIESEVAALRKWWAENKGKNVLKIAATDVAQQPAEEPTEVINQQHKPAQFSFPDDTALVYAVSCVMRAAGSPTNATSSLEIFGELYVRCVGRDSLGRHSVELRSHVGKWSAEGIAALHTNSIEDAVLPIVVSPQGGFTWDDSIITNRLKRNDLASDIHREMLRAMSVIFPVLPPAWSGSPTGDENENVHYVVKEPFEIRGVAGVAEDRNGGKTELLSYFKDGIVQKGRTTIVSPIKICTWTAALQNGTGSQARGRGVVDKNSVALKKSASNPDSRP